MQKQLNQLRCCLCCGLGRDAVWDAESCGPRAGNHVLDRGADAAMGKGTFRGVYGRL